MKTCECEECLKWPEPLWEFKFNPYYTMCGFRKICSEHAAKVFMESINDRT